MKKITKAVGIAALGIAMISSIGMASGCTFEVNYTGTRDKLNEVIKIVNTSENFTDGSISIGGLNIRMDKIPNVSSAFVGSESYREVNNYYNTIFSYCFDYIKTTSQIIATPPTVESLTEYQENLYQTLEEEIEVFKNSIKEFEKEVQNVNKYFANAASYGESSEEIFVLNYKKAYRDLIYDTFDIANAIEDLTGSVYSEIHYKESSEKKGQVFKSLEEGINIRIFEGYFSFIADSFDCRKPEPNTDANEYMHEIISTYDSARVTMLTFYKNAKKEKGLISITNAEIEEVKETMASYFEETALYQEAYDKLNFVDFYFDNDCALDRYEKNDYANRNYYDRINDYINYTLPSLTNFVSTTFNA